MKTAVRLVLLFLALFNGTLVGRSLDKVIHVHEVLEVSLQASADYPNPYRDVDTWVQVQGPGFNKRIFGFWDGGKTFRFRLVATSEGEWSWVSNSNQGADKGLNGQTGTFTAKAWTESEKQENPNRRGFVQPTENGHALQYADGTPFFLLGDTWWAASTWRYPLSGKEPDPNWVPSAGGFSFENALHYRKKQGYNSIGMISCFPNWADDGYDRDYIDEAGVPIRGAWAKYANVAKDMVDESGNRAFGMSKEIPLADFDRLNPEYFRSLDRKMEYLAAIGFVPFFEVIRRDHGPSWKAYYDWPGSYVRFVQYLVARYGAYSMIFSPLHLDWLKGACLPPSDFNQAIVAWYRKCGPLPYGQPVTPLINEATHTTFGTGSLVPWLTMHSVGNANRNHKCYPLLEEQFALRPAMPTANLEAYYPAWKHNSSEGEIVEPNSLRDNYFARAQAWGCVLSGALAGHMYGTAAYDGTSLGEKRDQHPYIWEALLFPAGEQVAFVRKFVESEGASYWDLQPASSRLKPRKTNGSNPSGLDGWGFLMVTPSRQMAMLYFEYAATIPLISDLLPVTRYQLAWFDPLTGEWMPQGKVVATDNCGTLALGTFPDGSLVSMRDWALKVTAMPR